MGDERDRMEDFERALKAWARRPPRRSPQEAGRRVVEAARRRRRRRTIRTLVATAALLAIAWTLGVRRESPVPEAAPAAAPPLAPALGAGQALIWLDAETPLYMTFEAPTAAPGGRS